MNKEYKISISPQPDEEMGERPYFWCVLAWGKDTWYNDGCGWSETPQKAFEKAMEHYNQLIEEN